MTTTVATARTPAEQLKFSEWLLRERKLRELRYVLSIQVGKLRSSFPFARTEGVAYLLGLLRTALLSDADIARFVALQRSQNNINIARALVTHILLSQPASSSSSSSSSSDTVFVPAGAAEKAKALELLCGVCLLDKKSRAVVRECGGIDALLAIIDLPLQQQQQPQQQQQQAQQQQQQQQQQPQLHAVAVDALLSVLWDSRENQEVFRARQGFAKLKRLLVDASTPKEVRNKVAEFFFIAAVHLDTVASDSGVADYTKPSPHSPPTRTVITDLLGTAVVDALLRTMQIKRNGSRVALPVDDVLPAIDLALSSSQQHK